MKADAQTETAVLATLEQFKQAYEHRNMGHLLALFAPDADVVLFGTGADEKRIGLAEIQAQAERDWAQAEAFTLEWGWSSVSAAGSVAWVAADVVGHITMGGQEVHLPLRLTAVLEHRGGSWLWVQSHVSLPAAEQAEGESFPAAESH
ncbi:MAG TPA: nuclear transport factor 2 family protein [Ktedonobacterales bacterium]|nr:nuclear transport factor 2 family protein [Ktedonobacterales bacterium]